MPLGHGDSMELMWDLWGSHGIYGTAIWSAGHVWDLWGSDGIRGAQMGSMGLRWDPWGSDGTLRPTKPHTHSPEGRGPFFSGLGASPFSTETWGGEWGVIWG